MARVAGRPFGGVQRLLGERGGIWWDGITVPRVEVGILASRLGAPFALQLGQFGEDALAGRRHVRKGGSGKRTLRMRRRVWRMVIFAASTTAKGTWLMKKKYMSGC